MNFNFYRGPRAGLMFYRRKCLKDGEDLKNRLDFSVFPRLQGGPHQHCIAGFFFLSVFFFYLFFFFFFFFGV